MSNFILLDGLWHCDHDSIRALICAIANVDVLFLKDFEATVGVAEESLRAVGDILYSIRDEPVQPGAIPSPCSDAALVTGSHKEDDAYLLRISPEGHRVLICGLATALKEIAEWEFKTRVTFSRAFIESLLTALKAADGEATNKT